MEAGYLERAIELGNGGVICSQRKEGLSRVVFRVEGRYEQARYWYNQMACLIGAVLVQTLQAMPSSMRHSRSMPAGTWPGLPSHLTAGGPATLFQLACCGPSDAADAVGFQAFHDRWPEGASALSGVKKMGISMAGIGNIFYGIQHMPSVQVGMQHDVSTRNQVNGALKVASLLGYTVHEEAVLRKFIATIDEAKILQFVHEIQV